MSDNLGQQSVRLVVNCGNAVVAFVRGHALPLIGSAVLVLLVWQSWSWYDSYRTKELVFLMGGSTGGSVDNARSIKDKMETAGALGGTTYSVHLEPTGGYEENRRRISEDETGCPVGFAYDGFGDSKNVSVVLPLDQRYLHILCRKGFVDQTLPDRDQNAALSFRDISSLLEPGRVYLGTAGSATRQCAHIVLKQFHLDPDKLGCYGVGGFAEMRAALNRDHIDLAFSSGPFNSSTLLPIALDGNCVLVGLNNDRDAIVQQYPQLLPVELEANSFVSGEFCPNRLETIGARRVLICSDLMSAEDVYVVGMSTVEALRDTMPDIARTTTASSEAAHKRWETRYPLHAGARMILENREPSTSPQWFNVILATALLWGMTELLRWLNSLFGKKREETAATVGASDITNTQEVEPTGADQGDMQEAAYGALERDLGERIAELECAPVPLTKVLYEDWGGQINELRERILKANRTGKITRERTHALLEGLRRELVYEYEIRKPVTRKRVSRQ